MKILRRSPVLIALYSSIAIYAFAVANRDFGDALRASETCAHSAVTLGRHWELHPWTAILWYSFIRAWIEIMLLALTLLPPLNYRANQALGAARSWLDKHELLEKASAWEVPATAAAGLAFAFAFSDCESCSVSSAGHCGIFFGIVGFGIALPLVLANSLRKYRDIYPPSFLA